MRSPNKPYNHIVSHTAASAKSGILVSAPKFDTGANTFLLFSQGGEKALFTLHRLISFFSSLFLLTLPFSSFYIFYPKEYEAIIFKALQKAY